MSLLRFGDFTLDRVNKVLQRGERLVIVQRKVFACIELFTMHAGELISEERLRQGLWPDTRVSAAAVRRVIREARRVLGDRGDKQSMIQTRRGIGHVFVVRVTRHPGPAASTVAATGTWPFVGRQAELSELHAALAGVPGQGILWLVSGEAGAGKTRLLAELRGQIPDSAERWFTGHCHAGEQTPAFWPWREVLTGILSSASLGPPLRALIEQEPELLGLFPELGGHTSRGRKRREPTAERRFDICQVFVKILRRLSSAARLVVVIEDMHWADDGSVLLLEMLSRAAKERPHALIATCRMQDIARGAALSDAIGRIVGRVGVRNVELKALTLAETEQLASAIYPARTAKRAAEIAQCLSGGNPLFTELLLRHQLSSGSNREKPPATLQHLVLARVAPLPRATRLLLEQAAVLGHEFSIGLLATMTRRAEARVRQQLQPAFALGIIARGRGFDEIIFSHALVRDALYDALADEARRGHHSRALSVARGLPSGPERSSVLAVHAFLAGAAVGAGRTQRLCERAGRESFQALSFDRAALHMGRALSLLDARAPLVLRAELTLLWARARWQADEPPETVKRVFLEAAELARAADAPEIFGSAAIGFAIGEDSVLDLDSAVDRRAELALLEEAWERMPLAQRELRHRVARTLCWLQTIAGEHAASCLHAERALQSVPVKPDAWTRTLNLGMRMLLGPQARALVLSDAEDLRRDPTLTLHQRMELCLHAMGAGLTLGDAASYRRSRHELDCLTAGLEPSQLGRVGRRLTRWLLVPLAARATEAVLAGNFEDAERWMAELLVHSRSLERGRDAMRGQDVMQLPWLLLGYRGRRNALLPVLEARSKAEYEQLWQLSIARAECALERGALRQAAVDFCLLRETKFQRPVRGALASPTLPTLVRIADLAVALGNSADAELLQARLSPTADVCASDGVLVSLGSTARPLAEMASKLGDDAGAERLLRAALAMNESAEHRPELARTSLAWGRTLRRLGRERDGDAAIASARAAAAAMQMVLPE